MAAATTFHSGTAELTIPVWVSDLESFRRWIDSEEVDEKARISWYNGQVWIDMSKEQVFTHVLVKTKFIVKLGTLVEANNLGLFLADGVRLTNLDADISVKPDATFASRQSRQLGLVRQVKGAKGGFVELEGSPDMVLEIVSDSSVAKDKRHLRERYAAAGIREFWLVDARKEPLQFDILRLTARGFVACRKQEGWIRSTVFAKSFRLSSREDAQDGTEFTLEMR